MGLLKFQSVKFLTSVASISQLPKPQGQKEVAVVGRSNVGKSTLLNHLFGTKNLVKTSATPGKTQMLNFFEVDKTLLFVDLPGYGYAGVSKGMKKQWGKLIDDYLNSSEQLTLILLLIDGRRDLSEEDEAMLLWIEARGVPAAVVITKVDKLNQSERAALSQKITSRLKDLPCIHYSATKNIGRKELIAAISQLTCY